MCPRCIDLPPWNAASRLQPTGALVAATLACVVVVLGATRVFADPAPPSLSKLSIHQLTSYSPGAAQIIQAHPRVLKVMGIATGPPLAAVHDYKASTPDGVVVLREYTGNQYLVTDDAAASALHFWNTVLAPPLNLLSPEDRALIDYVEGPNEGDSTPTWGSPEDTAWYNGFWMTLAPLIANAGFKPCAFSISVGNPPGSLGDMLASINRITPALRLVKSLGGAWSYHAYTIPYTTDVDTELWFSLRYRRYYDYFATAHPDLVDMPLILTEGGVDGHPGPGGAGWQNAGDAETYKNWLTWFDQRMREDDYVLGVTLFQCGSPGWPSYEIEPIAGWMADYLNSQDATPTITLSSTGWTRTITEGDGLPDDAFTVRNSSGGMLDYDITSDAAWLAVSPPSGTTTVATNPHTIDYSVTGLARGAYDAMVTVTDDNADNSPQTLNVHLVVEPPKYRGDFDRDLDIDLNDYGHFQVCMTGAGVVQQNPACQDADLDGDTDVDPDDFGILQGCMSGTNIVPVPQCEE